MRPYILAESNWKAIKDQKVELVVLPWGATEAHNYHLPYGTDVIEAEAIAAEAARIAREEGARVMVLPCVPFGVNTGQADITLDLNINPSTQLQIVRDLVTVLDRQEIRKLLILNTHGGNAFKPILREVGLAFPDMFLVSCFPFGAVDKTDFFDADGDHADEMETSLLLYLQPDLVLPLDEAGEGKERLSVIRGIREGWAWAERQWSMVTDDTGIGNPKAATREKGERYFKAVIEKVAELMVELAEVDPEERYG